MGDTTGPRLSGALRPLSLALLNEVPQVPEFPITDATFIHVGKRGRQSRACQRGSTSAAIKHGSFLDLPELSIKRTTVFAILLCRSAKANGGNARSYSSTHESRSAPRISASNLC